MAKMYYKHLGCALYGLMGFLGCVVAMYVPPFMLLIDTAFLASGLSGKTVQQLRPLIMLFFKSGLNTFSWIARGYFGSAMRIMMPWWHGLVMAMMSAIIRRHATGPAGHRTLQKV